MILDKCWQHLSIWWHLMMREFISQQHILAISWNKVGSILAPSRTIVGYMLVNYAKLARSWTKVCSSLSQDMDELCQDFTNLAWFTNTQPTLIQLAVNVGPTLVQDAGNLCWWESNSHITKYRKIPGYYHHLFNVMSTCCQDLGKIMLTCLQHASKIWPTKLCPKRYSF